MKPYDPDIDMNEDKVVPYDESPQGSHWIDWVIWFQFGSGAFWIFGLPFYLGLGAVVWWYYAVEEWMAIY